LHFNSEEFIDVFGLFLITLVAEIIYLKTGNQTINYSALWLGNTVSIVLL